MKVRLSSVVVVKVSVSSWITHAFLIWSLGYGPGDSGRFLVVDLLLQGPVLILSLVLVIVNSSASV